MNYLEMFSTYVFLRESSDTDEQARTKATELKPLLADYLDDAVAYCEGYFVY